MPPCMDAGLIRKVASSQKTIPLLLASSLLACSSGCFLDRIVRPAPTHETPEYRASSAQNPPAPMPAIEAPPPPRVETAASSGESPLRRLARNTAASERKLDSYLVRVRRQETINGEDQPLEYVLCKYRRGPLSMHCKWLGDEGKGREIVYVKGQHDDKIHILTGQTDLFGAGMRMAFSPDSPLVRAKFRYPITEASLGAGAQRFVAAVDSFERAQPGVGSLKFLGMQTRPEFPSPLEAVEHTIPPNTEPCLGKGGVRFYYFDAALNLPMLIVTLDHDGHQVEYYCFDRLQTPVPLDDADFDPVKLWPKQQATSAAVSPVSLPR